VPFKSLGAVSLPSIVIMAVSVAVCVIFSVKERCDLENGLGFVQGHLKWHHLIDRSHTGSYSPSIVTMAISCNTCIVFET